MAGHWNVSMDSCCTKSLRMRALSGLVLSSFIKMIDLSANGWLSNWGSTRALSTLSRYAMPLKLLCKTCKHNLQLKEKHPKQLHRRHRTLNCTHHVPLMKCSTSMPPNSSAVIHGTQNKSDQWTHFQLRIFQRRWSRDEFHWVRRWRNDSCSRFMGRFVRRCCFWTVCLHTRPLKIQLISNTNARSRTFINHSSRLQTQNKTIHYRMVPPPPFSLPLIYC